MLYLHCENTNPLRVLFCETPNLSNTYINLWEFLFVKPIDLNHEEKEICFSPFDGAVILELFSCSFERAREFFGRIFYCEV